MGRGVPREFPGPISIWDFGFWILDLGFESFMCFVVALTILSQRDRKKTTKHTNHTKRHEAREKEYNRVGMQTGTEKELEGK
jgi:hypothetical protein